MKQEHKIYKYPNRRLYDTDASRYITLADIRKLVIDDIPFRVLERRTQKDVTDRTLLQALLEQVEATSLALPREFIFENLRLLSASAEVSPS